jgi:small-conductance mechanosensitive channel
MFKGWLFNYLFPIVTFSFWQAVGAIAGGLIASKGAKDANKETAASTARQMAFQERMSNTAHQRQVKDLRKAGINPILSAKLGGASSPSGASYVAQNELQTLGDNISSMYAQYHTAQQQQSASQLNQAQVNKTNQEIDNLKATESLTNEQKLQVSETIEKIKAEIGMIGQNMQQSRATIKKLQADTKMSEALSTIPKIIEKNLEGMDETSISQKTEAVYNYFFPKGIGMGPFDTFTGPGANFNNQGSFAPPNIR